METRRRSELARWYLLVMALVTVSVLFYGYRHGGDYVGALLGALYGAVAGAMGGAAGGALLRNARVGVHLGICFGAVWGAGSFYSILDSLILFIPATMLTTLVFILFFRHANESGQAPPRS
jgi:hypothetical protein